MEAAGIEPAQDSPGRRDHRQRPGTWLYFVQSGAEGPVKVGVSDKPRNRVKNLQVGNPEPLTLLGAAYDETGELEAEVHDWLRGEALRGEWFKPTPPVFDLLDALDEWPRDA